jgi:hypothetical protein
MKRAIGNFGKIGLECKRAIIAIVQLWLFNRWAKRRLNRRECGWQV